MFWVITPFTRPVCAVEVQYIGEDIEMTSKRIASMFVCLRHVPAKS